MSRCLPLAARRAPPRTRARSDSRRRRNGQPSDRFVSWRRYCGSDPRLSSRIQQARARGLARHQACRSTHGTWKLLLISPRPELVAISSLADLRAATRHRSRLRCSSRFRRFFWVRDATCRASLHDARARPGDLPVHRVGRRARRRRLPRRARRERSAHRTSSTWSCSRSAGATSTASASSISRSRASPSRSSARACPASRGASARAGASRRSRRVAVGRSPAWVVLERRSTSCYGYWDLAQRESFFDWFVLPSVALQLVAHGDRSRRRPRRSACVVRSSRSRARSASIPGSASRPTRSSRSRSSLALALDRRPARCRSRRLLGRLRARRRARGARPSSRSSCATATSARWLRITSSTCPRCTASSGRARRARSSRLQWGGPPSALALVTSVRDHRAHLRRADAAPRARRRARPARAALGSRRRAGARAFRTTSTR